MTKRKSYLNLGLGALLGYTVGQQAWILTQLAKANVKHSLMTHINQGMAGTRILRDEETATYTLHHTVEDGIERVSVYPKQRCFETPIVMQHGMWHGAWCWESWQKMLAIMGWESHAHSLPGHAASPVQRPIFKCTLDYYLAFLKAEMDRHAVKPVLMGHSMGGALTQWYLKHVGDDLPAAVLVGAWDAHQVMNPAGIVALMQVVPGFIPGLLRTWDAWPIVNSPEKAAKALLSPDAHIGGAELFRKLCPESILVLYQHNPPFWSPPKHVHTPLYWLASEKDAVLLEKGQRESAAFYGAEYHVAPAAGHDVMFDVGSETSVRGIHQWLAGLGIT